MTFRLQLNSLTHALSLKISGTTLAILPIDDAIAVHQQIPGATFDDQSGFTVPCNTTTVLSFTFGKQAFDIDPRDLAFVPLKRGDPNGDCISGITAGDINGPTVWLVSVFSITKYLHFDHWYLSAWGHLPEERLLLH